MATMQSLLDRTRLELGDQPKTFRQEWYGDGTTNRWELDYSPLDADSVIVTVDGVNVSNDCEVEEAAGVLTFDTAPGPDAKVVVSGTYFRYFTSAELTTLINSAVQEHLHNRVNAFNQAMSLATIPYVEEGVIALRATIKALFVLATDASFDIDIQTPDGVTIPRSERYRQLMGMIAERERQYYHIAEALNVGPYRAEVFTLRRVSKMTNKYIPVYRPQEIDDYSFRERVYLPIPTYGAAPIPSTAAEYDLAMVQGDTYTQTFDFDIDLTGVTVTAQARTFPQSPVVAAQFTVTVLDALTGQVQLSLTPAQTKLLPLRSYWDLQIDQAGTITTVVQGNVFCQREVTRA